MTSSLTLLKETSSARFGFSKVCLNESKHRRILNIRSFYWQSVRLEETKKTSRAHSFWGCWRVLWDVCAGQFFTDFSFVGWGLQKFSLFYLSIRCWCCWVFSDCSDRNVNWKIKVFWTNLWEVCQKLQLYFWVHRAITFCVDSCLASLSSHERLWFAFKKVSLQSGKAFSRIVPQFSKCVFVFHLQDVFFPSWPAHARKGSKFMSSLLWVSIQIHLLCRDGNPMRLCQMNK